MFAWNSTQVSFLTHPWHFISHQNKTSLTNTSLTRISLSELEDSGVYLFIYFFDMVLLTFCEYALTHSSASFHRDWKVFSGIVLILLSISNLKKAELLSETMQRAAKCCWKTGINGYISFTLVSLNHVLKVCMTLLRPPYSLNFVWILSSSSAHFTAKPHGSSPLSPMLSFYLWSLKMPHMHSFETSLDCTSV